MENVIYNELRMRGFSVDVGMVEIKEKQPDGTWQRKQLEIDFVANKGSRRYYTNLATIADGRSEMIPAIEEAVMTMAPGAKVTLLTPSSLAFGEFDLGETLPPYSPLMIELELVEVK